MVQQNTEREKGQIFIFAQEYCTNAVHLPPFMKKKFIREDVSTIVEVLALIATLVGMFF